jgi:ABC-type Fe3+ transport system permease subunit
MEQGKGEEEKNVVGKKCFPFCGLSLFLRRTKRKRQKEKVRQRATFQKKSVIFCFGFWIFFGWLLFVGVPSFFFAGFDVAQESEIRRTSESEKENIFCWCRVW